MAENNTDLLSHISVGRESGTRAQLGHRFRLFHKAAVKVLARVGVSAEVSAGEGWDSEPVGLLAEGSSLCAVDRRVPSVSCYVGPSNMTTGFLREAVC